MSETPDSMETPYPPPQAGTSPPQASEVAGFWRRLLAFMLDGLLIGLVAGGLGWAMFDTFARMGGLERLVGFAIALLYAGVMNSRIGNGRTLGKMLMGIRVVGIEGELLSLPRACLRQIVFAVPFFLNYLPVSPQLAQSWLGSLIGLVVLGGLFAIIYLFAFNGRTRQSLHDLVVGSYVARYREGDGRPEPLTARVWRTHLVVVATIAMASLLAPTIAARWLDEAPFQDLVAVDRELGKLPDVQHVAATSGWSKQMGAKEITYTSVVLKLSTPRVDDEEFARRAAKIVLANSPGSHEQDFILVRLRYGYDMVIASGWRSQDYRFDPELLK